MDREKYIKHITRSDHIGLPSNNKAFFSASEKRDPSKMPPQRDFRKKSSKLYHYIAHIVIYHIVSLSPYFSELFDGVTV